MAGKLTLSPKLRIGFFAQHQLDELTEGENAIQHIQRRRPDEKQSQLRARLGAGGIGADIAETAVERLSGGQKARLLMILMALDAPQMIILDEPTNHLDMESREALALALNDYPGAVILISHDPFLVEAVADRLWLVNDGAVKPFEGDMDDYRALLLGQRGAGGRVGAQAAPTPPRRRPTPQAKRDLAALRAEVAACEARMDKLAAMQSKIDELLADPNLYTDPDPLKFEKLKIKRAEVMAGMSRAEALWLQAQERLEEAEAEAA